MKSVHAHQFSPKSLAASIALILAPQAFGEETNVLEEILVVSQIRVQNLQEVPVSVSAVTGDKVERMGIENIEDLTAFVPNVNLAETGLSTQLRIRGIGSGNSQGFEQSVGMFVDGIDRSRAQLYRGAFFDLERIEVMRGPQVTYFGKNTIAGTVNIITAKPTDELEGKISASYETEFETQEYNAYVSGPLSDSLKGRLAVRYYDDPGYMENSLLNTEAPNKEQQAVRASLDWEITNNLDLVAVFEHSEFDVLGRATEITQDTPASPAPPFGGYAGLIGAINAGNTFESELDYVYQFDVEEYSNNEMDALSISLNYDWDDYTVTWVTGATDFTYRDVCECDYSPASFFSLEYGEEYDQFSQELRIVSPSEQKVEWLAGIFYQKYEQFYDDLLRVPTNSGLIPILSQNPNLAPIAPQIAGTGIAREFQQDSKSIGIFGEATIDFTDTWHLSLGGRYTQEDKDGAKFLNVVDITNGNAILNNPAAAAVYLNVFNADTEQSTGIPNSNDANAVSPGHNLKDSRSEKKFTPSVNMSVDVNDDMIAYLKYSLGFKSGGYDPRSSDSDSFEFDDEKAKSWELGYKMTLAEGSGELNVALYRTDYENLQFSQFDGGVNFNVGNVKETVVQGIEIDGRWQLSKHLRTQFGAAYLDFEYKDFQNANCHYGATPVVGTINCDFSGKRGIYTPEYTINGSLEYSHSVNEDFLFVGVLDFQWMDEQNVHVNLDPMGQQDATTDVSLRLAFESDHWDFAILGKNLLNEDRVSHSANMPLSETFAGSNSYYSFVKRPRTLALETTFKF